MAAHIKRTFTYILRRLRTVRAVKPTTVRVAGVIVLAVAVVKRRVAAVVC